MKTLEHNPEGSEPRQKDESSLWPEERVKMYNIPGRPPVTQKDVARYEKTKEELIKRLPVPIQKGLGNEHWDVRAAAAKMIEQVPEKERAALIQKGLGDEIWDVREIAAKMIEQAPEGARAALIQKGLEDKGQYIREIAAKMIAQAPKEKQDHLRAQLPALIQKGLEDKDWNVRKAAAKMIEQAPKEKQDHLRAQLPALIQKGLEDKGQYIREIAAEMIGQAPEGERAALIQKGLEDKDWDVRAAAAKMIEQASEKERTKLWAQYEHAITKKGVNLEQLAETTPLYRNAPPRFFQADFNKTGSRTTLLHAVPGQPENTLKGRTIIRHIPFSAYLTWARAFEASDFWKAKGFEYVPVEPIIRVRPDQENIGKVAVFAGVLGPSVDTWEQNTILFRVYIDQEMKRIKNALETLGIKHGHTHEGNFCLVFNKTKEGKADLTKPPRVYVIDFDMAVSSGPGR